MRAIDLDNAGGVLDGFGGEDTVDDDGEEEEEEEDLDWATFTGLVKTRDVVSYS
jgi:hypothetical protein